jgi:hypothetical protein
MLSLNFLTLKMLQKSSSQEIIFKKIKENGVSHLYYSLKSAAYNFYRVNFLKEFLMHLKSA